MYNERINLKFDLSKLAIEICNQHNLGKYISHKMIEIGYEDFNFVLHTNLNNYLIKVFSTKKTDEDCFSVTQKQHIAYANKINCPEIFEFNNTLVQKITLNETAFRYCVMQYINGKDLFSLNQLPNLQELEYIAKQIATLNNIDFKPNTYYDEWNILNFLAEYNKNHTLLPDNLKPLVSNVYNQAQNLDILNLPKGFTHGDIICTNILKSENGLTLIDFSVGAYQPRLIDIAVSVGDLCINTNSKKLTNQNISAFLNAYNSISKLTEQEMSLLKLFLQIHQANSILQCIIEKELNKNNSDENLNFLTKSEQYLNIINSIEINDFQ